METKSLLKNGKILKILFALTALSLFIMFSQAIVLGDDDSREHSYRNREERQENEREDNKYQDRQGTEYRDSDDDNKDSGNWDLSEDFEDNENERVYKGTIDADKHGNDFIIISSDDDVLEKQNRRERKNQSYDKNVQSRNDANNLRDESANAVASKPVKQNLEYPVRVIGLLPAMNNSNNSRLHGKTVIAVYPSNLSNEGKAKQRPSIYTIFDHFLSWFN